MAENTKQFARGFIEIGDRVWVARYEWYDVNVSVVEGEAGLIVVDTHASSQAAQEVIADLRRLSARPVIGLVNTHDHIDHVFGNSAFRQEYGEIPITATDSASETTLGSGERAKASWLASGDDRAAEIGETTIVPADHTFSSVAAIDLGDRSLELVHPGRGHTAGDLVVRIDDADILLTGDLVEESGMPAYGDDCFPLDWPHALDLTLELIGPGTVVVPGHGSPVDRDFVWGQRSSIGVVAQTIYDLAGRGIPPGEALDAESWPYPREHLAHAVRRGYDQLPRNAKRLPLA